MAIPQEKTPRISIITVSYEDDELTLRFLKKLGIHPQVEIIVVDNSKQNSLEAKLPQDITYIHLETNKGYGGALNAGFAHSRGDWIMFLNNDIETTIQDVIQLVDTALKLNTKLATPKLILQDGTAQKSIGYFDHFTSHLINGLFARPRFIDPTNITKEIKVDVVTGAAMLFKREILEENGLFDEKNFFMYFEDIDLCYRLHKKDKSFLFVPQVQMKHLQSVTTNKDTSQKQTNYKKSVQAYLYKQRGFIIATLAKLLNVYK